MHLQYHLLYTILYPSYTYYYIRYLQRAHDYLIVRCEDISLSSIIYHILSILLYTLSYTIYNLFIYIILYILSDASSFR